MPSTSSSVTETIGFFNFDRFQTFQFYFRIHFELLQSR